jgi:hypothetical protein
VRRIRHFSCITTRQLRPALTNRIHRQPNQLLLAAAAAQQQVAQQLIDPAAPGAVAANNNASLVPTPCNLFDIWTEWTVGIGGRKPAKDFTARERGAVKHKYGRRKRVCDIISALIRAGHTVPIAIDRIYTVYGANSSVTLIINRLIADINGHTLHPTLVS